jgi:hypothetical protein
VRPERTDLRGVRQALVYRVPWRGGEIARMVLLTAGGTFELSSPSVAAGVYQHVADQFNQLAAGSGAAELKLRFFDWQASLEASWEGYLLAAALLGFGAWLGLVRSSAVVWRFDGTAGLLVTREYNGLGQRERSYDLSDIFRAGATQFAGTTWRLYLMLRSGRVVQMPFTLGNAPRPAHNALAQINDFLALRHAPAASPDDASATRWPV